MSDQHTIADRDAAVGPGDEPDEAAVVADHHLALRPQLEEAAGVDARFATNANRVRATAGEMSERVGAVEPAALAKGDGVGALAVVPVVLESHRAVSRAGLPATVAPGATSPATTAPAWTRAARPMRLPFRTIAPIPIHAPSSITTGLVPSSGRSAASPPGE